MTDNSTTASAAFRAARVSDVMSFPLVTCSAEVPLREVAELMTRHRIHAVVVLDDPAVLGPARRPWSVISELDLIAAAPFDDPEVTAGRVAGTPVVVIAPDEPLARAALLMAEYAITHLIAVDGEGEPAGIVSALDVARAVSPPLEEPLVGAKHEDRGDLPTAAPGDRLVIRAHHLGEAGRDAEILEVRGPGGRPPFLVRWEDTGAISLLYPGSDAVIHPLGERGP
jgi:CBS domain-containing protein